MGSGLDLTEVTWFNARPCSVGSALISVSTELVCVEWVVTSVSIKLVLMFKTFLTGAEQFPVSSGLVGLVLSLLETKVTFQSSLAFIKLIKG